MIRQLNILILTILIAGVSLIGRAQEGSYISYFDGQTIHLRWNAYPDGNIDGYTLFRQNEGAEWSQLNSNPLSVITEKSQLQDKLGYRYALYLSLFGIKSDTTILTQAQVKRVLSDNKSRTFLEALATVNPDFGDLLGLVYHDSAIISQNRYRYRIDVSSEGNPSPWVTTDWIMTKASGSVPPVIDISGSGEDQRNIIQWIREPEYHQSGEIVTYRIYRSESLLGPYSQRNVYGILPIRVNVGENMDPNQEQYADNYLTNGKPYFYYVTAVNAFGIESVPSTTLELIPGSDVIPKAPINLQGEITANIIKLQWESRNQDIDGVEVFRSENPSEDFSLIWPQNRVITTKRNFYFDQGLEEGKEYKYFIRFFKGKSTGIHSDTLTVRIPDFTPPDTPHNVRAEAIDGGIKISWDPNSEPDILGYEITRTSDTAFRLPFQLNAGMISGTEYVDSISELSQTTFGYQVSAYDLNYNRSEPSELIKARMPDIVAPAIPIITKYQRSGGDISISWTISNDLDLKEYLTYISKDSADFETVYTGLENSCEINLTESGTYRLKITCRDQSGNESKASEIVSFSFDSSEYPVYPENFKAKRNRDNTILLSWNPVVGENLKAYLLYRTDLETGNILEFGEINPEITEYLDRRTKPKKKYEYSIQSMNKNWKMSPPVTIKIETR